MTALAGGWSADFPRHSCAQMFGLAVRIEDYPRFIPWCLDARVRAKAEGALEVDNHFGAGPVEVRFRSRAVFAEPERLEITSSDGPFRRFRLLWRFEPLGTGGCRVYADYQLDLRSPLLQALARLSLREMERRVVRRFRERARQLYGA